MTGWGIQYSWSKTANVNLFLFSLFCCGCTWILQQVGCFIFFPVDCFSFPASFDSQSIVHVPRCSVSSSANTELRRRTIMFHVQSYSSHLTDPLPPLLPRSLPGSQIYHSAVCVLVQFLMLRLMGRTVTTVLSSFTFQVVRCPSVCFYFSSPHFYTSLSTVKLMGSTRLSARPLHCVMALMPPYCLTHAFKGPL